MMSLQLEAVSKKATALEHENGNLKAIIKLLVVVVGGAMGEGLAWGLLALTRRRSKS